MSEPLLCPRCGDVFRFSSVSELKVHLITRHTYETLLLLSQARVRSSRPRSLLPLTGPTEDQSRSSSLDTALQDGPLPLEGVDVPWGRLTQVLWTVDIGPEERLGLGVTLGAKVARTLEEVEERVTRKVTRLKTRLDRKKAELKERHADEQQLRLEKQELNERVAFLSRQVCAVMEVTEKLKKELEEKEQELNERQQEMVDIECCLRGLAEKEANAKAKLQVFIESLLDRADRAERHLLLLTSEKTHLHSPVLRYRLSPEVSPVRGGASLDDIITSHFRESIGNRRSFSVSGPLQDPLPHLHSGQGPRVRTHSLGSQGWDPDFMFHHVTSDWSQTRPDATRFVEEGWGRTWSRAALHHSTEDEDEEEEYFLDQMRPKVLAQPKTTDVRLPHCSSPPHLCGDRRVEGAEPAHMRAQSVRMRAGLFCVFPYLDVHSLLTAAQVCLDWRMVARHPAVWTFLRLEDDKISSQFLVTMSQWCTQTQSIVLKNLKPRDKRTTETPDEYQRSIRGSLEPGLEFLLRSAGGSVNSLSVLNCAHILTERALWLASCYCRNLSSLIYRSRWDPPGQEVLWALGAGCRSISSLQVAPAHPCQQRSGFGNRCLQTIGRCWPHLRSLGVGGASCGTQGLVAVVRSCSELQHLELEWITDLSLQVATELCGAGLKQLQSLRVVHTPVSGQAILHFYKVCSSLRSLQVHISVQDYFENPNSGEAKSLFREILSTLQVLEQRPGLCDVLQVQTDSS